MLYPLYVDLDGVLADFDRAVFTLFGRPSRNIPDSVLWPRIGRTEGFFRKLPLTKDARALWDFIHPHSPTVLTGIPSITRNFQGDPAEQKREWVAEHFGTELPVITCFSRDKHTYCIEPGSVLIDDTGKLAEAWTKAGGNFVWHNDLATTLDELRALGYGKS